MIEVDISNIWGQVTLPDLLSMEAEVAAAYEALPESDGEQVPVWMAVSSQERSRIRAAAEKIRSDSEICVVVGTGGACQGARAAMEALQGPERNESRGKGDPQIFFWGNSLSTRQANSLLARLEGRDFSVIVVSKTGTTLETALGLRSLRWMLERKLGTDEANRRIYAVTAANGGALEQMARQEGWETFFVPDEVPDHYGVLTAAGLLPMAVAGLDVDALASGAEEAWEGCRLGSFENPVWLYAAVRNLLYRSGKHIELLAVFEPGQGALAAWWQQLFAQSEGKAGKGLFPATAEFTRDLYTLGQLIQQGSRNLFETVVRFAPDGEPFSIGAQWNNPDGLNYLEGKRLDFVEERANLAMICAHVDGGTPVITMDCGRREEASLGALFCLMQLSCALSARVLGADPFALPGLEDYEENRDSLLGKPAEET